MKALTYALPYPVHLAVERKTMSVFRIQLVNGDRRTKADLKAPDEARARASAEKWFGDSHWQIVDIKRVS